MEIPLSVLIIEKSIFLLAFGLAVKQYTDSKRQIEKLQELVSDLEVQSRYAKEQSERLLDIEKSLNTRYIGVFPDHIFELSSFVSRTRKTLKVLCEFPGYGSFSNPKAFQDYEEAIIKQIDDNQNFKMNFICVNSELREKLISLQFPFDEVEWKEWKTTKAEQIQKFFKKYTEFKKIELESLLLEHFKKHLEGYNLKLLREVFKESDNVVIKQTSDPSPILCWIRDDEDPSLMDAEAIIVLRSFADNKSQFCFLTKDTRFIKAIQGIFNTALSGGTPSHSVSV